MSKLIKVKEQLLVAESLVNERRSMVMDIIAQIHACMPYEVP
jgi:hypothetical protein